MRQTLGDAVLILKSGDPLHFMSDTPHSFANTGDRPAKLMWAETSPRLLGHDRADQK